MPRFVFWQSPSLILYPDGKTQFGFALSYAFLILTGILLLATYIPHHIDALTLC